MQRVFMKPVGRHRAGDIGDYPMSTWKTFYPGYERFTRPVSEITEAAVKDAVGDRPRRSVRGGRR